MKIRYFFIIVGVISIAFRKKFAETATLENREIMSIVYLVAGIVLIVFGLLAVFNIIQVND